MRQPFIQTYEDEHHPVKLRLLIARRGRTGWTYDVIFRWVAVGYCSAKVRGSIADCRVIEIAEVRKNPSRVELVARWPDGRLWKAA